MHTITLTLLRRSIEEGISTTINVPPSQPPAGVAHATSTRRSVETLVVILAAITIMVAAAGICARVCGGRHLAGGGGGESDVEGWMERHCRSCLDGGVAPLAESAADAGSKLNEARK